MGSKGSSIADCCKPGHEHRNARSGLEHSELYGVEPIIEFAHEETNAAKVASCGGAAVAGRSTSESNNECEQPQPSSSNVSSTCNAQEGFSVKEKTAAEARLGRGNIDSSDVRWQQTSRERDVTPELPTQAASCSTSEYGTAESPSGADESMTEFSYADETSVAGDSSVGGDASMTEDCTSSDPGTLQRPSQRRLSFSQMLGSVKSSATEMVVDNPRDIHDIYELKSRVSQRKDSAKDLIRMGTIMQGKVKATGAVRTVQTVSKDNMKKAKRAAVAKEIHILRRLDHPNIVLLREIYEDTSTVFLVFEYCSGGTLQSKLDKASGLTEVQTAIVMANVLRAVYYLHSKHICHRDLTPRNIVIAEKLHDQVIGANTLFKVNGFSSACKYKAGGRLTREKGTPSHMAPEVSTKCYTQACDLWSCGVIMHQALCGQLPFPAENPDKKTTCFLLRAADGCDSSNVSQGAKDLLGLLLEPDAVARYSAEQALHHKWIGRALPKLTHVPLHADLVQNLRDFRSLHKFKRASLQVVASMLKQTETSVPRKIFHLADLNGDGFINESELMEQIRKAPNLKVDVDMEKMFADNDSSKGGCKDFGYTEFLAATFDRKQCLRDDVLLSAFACFDKNGDGTISFSELATGHLLGELSLEELGQILDNFDTNKDSCIDFEEFKAMMLQDNSDQKGVAKP